MVKFEDVPKEQRLNYYTGEIVISDSFAEHEARVVWRELERAHLVSGKQPHMFGRLLPRLRDAFAMPQVPNDLREIALELLDTTRKWDQYRRDLVHDLLVMGWGRTDDVHSAFRKHSPRPMREIVDCASGLRECSYRLRGLWIISPHWLGTAQEVWEEADDLRSWTRVAMGHLADVPGVIMGTKGPAPEPPPGWDGIVAAAAADRETRETQTHGLQVVIDPFEVSDY